MDIRWNALKLLKINCLKDIPFKPALKLLKINCLKDKLSKC